MVAKSYLKYSADPAAAPLGLISSSASNALFHGKHVIAPALESVLVWDWRLGKVVATWNDRVNAQVSCMSRFNDTYAIGYSDGSIRIWINNICACQLNGHKSPISALAFDKSGERLASGSKDTDIVIWDILGECGLYRLKGHKNQITGIVFINDLNHIATTSKDSLLKLWDLVTQHCVETIVAHRSEIWALAIHEDERTLFTAAHDSELRVWKLDHEILKNKLNTNNEELKESLTMHMILERKSKERAVSLQVFGRFFAVHGTDKSIEIFKIRNDSEMKKRLARRNKRLREKDMETMEVDEKVDDMVSHSILRCSAKVRSFEFGAALTKKSADNFSLMCALSNNSIEIYTSQEDDKNAEPFNLISTIGMQGHRSDIRTIALSSDDELIASGSIKIWNVSTKQCIKTLESGYALCCSFVPGNKHLIVGTKAGEIELYDLSSSSLIESIQAHQGPIWSLEVRPDRRGFTSGSADKEVRFWDFQLIADSAEPNGTSHKRLSIVHTRTLKMSDDVLCIRHSPDGKLLAVSLLDSTVKVFFMDTLKFSLSLYGHKLPILSMDISSDSTIIATASADKSIKIWGLDFGDCHRSLLAHTDSVMSIKFVWGTHYMFSASKDKSVKYWDGDKFEEISRLDGHHGEVWALAVAKFGVFIVTGSHDRSIRIWNKTDEQLFLEEERDRELETMYERDQIGRDGRGDDSAIGSGADDGSGDLILDPTSETLDTSGDSVGIAGKKTSDTLKAGEKIYEALEVWAEDRRAIDAYKEGLAKSLKNLIAPTPSPFIRALGEPNMTPELYVLHVLERIRASDLEQSLVVLPFVKIQDLLSCIASWSEAGVRVQLVTKVLTFIYRLHYNQITSSISSQTLAPLLKDITTFNQFHLEKWKDTLGFNLSALKMLIRAHEDEHQSNFFGEPQIAAESKYAAKARKRKTIISQ